MSINSSINKYLRKRAIIKAVENLSENSHFQNYVVIPVLAEYDSLLQTLLSLSKNKPKKVLSETSIILVINNRKNALKKEIADNQRLLFDLKSYSYINPDLLNIGWIDLSSPKKELPDNRGIGLARKIGMDSALQLIAEDFSSEKVPCLFSLDADTIVEENYIVAARKALLYSGSFGGVISFKHQSAKNKEQQRAIDEYECFMDHYVENLKRIGSPYAYHSMGSAIVCTAKGYAKAAGMHAKKTAGEDFYFLENLQKNGGVKEITSTKVFPSSRISVRNPFGTGIRIKQYCKGTPFEHYPKEAFDTLKVLFSIIKTNPNISGKGCLSKIDNKILKNFLIESGFAESWDKIRDNHTEKVARENEFHRWFDALKTLRFIRLFTLLKHLD
ncbi:MAG: hypothetical protein U9O87_11040 [Verrucomicrobiota bacterium]|nr:hypothetical protein [Verrucomicrobiota bacterium]